jgi:hypothetical protein
MAPAASPGSKLETPAIGNVPAARRARCMFCHALIGDEGAGFLDHVKGSPGCQAAYDAWLDNLDHDRPAG